MSKEYELQKSVTATEYGNQVFPMALKLVIIRLKKTLFLLKVLLKRVGVASFKTSL